MVAEDSTPVVPRDTASLVALAAVDDAFRQRRMERLDLPPIHGSRNPPASMELEGVQELSNLFERKVSAYQSASAARWGATRTSRRSHHVDPSEDF